MPAYNVVHTLRSPVYLEPNDRSLGVKCVKYTSGKPTNAVIIRHMKVHHDWSTTVVLPL